VAVRSVLVAAVAGDIYDFIELGQSSLGILVAGERSTLTRPIASGTDILEEYAVSSCAGVT